MNEYRKRIGPTLLEIKKNRERKENTAKYLYDNYKITAEVLSKQENCVEDDWRHTAYVIHFKKFGPGTKITYLNLDYKCGVGRKFSPDFLFAPYSF